MKQSIILYKILIKAYLSTLVLLGLSYALSSCKKKMICPAYQSYFIQDRSIADTRFSGFTIVEEDTVPPDVPPRVQLKYGILPKLTERKRWKAINTIEMAPLFATKPDTTQAFIVLGDSVEDVVSDVSREPIRTEINQDQVNYYLIMGPYLPKPKAKKEKEEQIDPEDIKLKKLMEKQEKAELKAFEKEERKKKRKGQVDKVPYLLPEELLDEYGNDPRKQRKPLKPVTTEEEKEDDF